MICLFKNHFIFLPPISNSISISPLRKLKDAEQMSTAKLQNFCEKKDTEKGDNFKPSNSFGKCFAIICKYDGY